MAAPVLETLLEIDEIDRVCLPGKRTRVSEMMAQKIGNDWTAEELIDAFPWYSPAAIYAALSYFAANEAKILAEIEEDTRYKTAIAAASPDTPARQRLRRLLAEQE